MRYGLFPVKEEEVPGLLYLTNLEDEIVGRVEWTDSEFTYESNDLEVIEALSYIKGRESVPFRMSERMPDGGIAETFKLVWVADEEFESALSDTIERALPDVIVGEDSMDEE